MKRLVSVMAAFLALIVPVSPAPLVPADHRQWGLLDPRRIIAPLTKGG